MPRRAYSYNGFKQAVSDILAGYGVQGQGLSRDAAGRQFKIGVLKVVDEDTWDRVGSNRQQVYARMEKDTKRVQALFRRLRKESWMYPQPSACFKSLVRLPFAPSLMPTHPLPPAAPEAFEEAHIPALDLKKKPSDLLYTFGPTVSCRRSTPTTSLKGLETVLPGDKWVQLMDAPGYGDCQGPFEHVQQDAEKLEQAWERTPAAHTSGRAAFKAVIEALLGRIVTMGVLKEAAEQENAKMIGEAYAVMLASLAVDKTIHLPSLRDIAFRRGQILSFAFESLGATRPS